MRKILDIPFGKAAERTLYLDALVPEAVSGPNPVLLWLHGGGWYEGNKRNIINQGALEPFVESGFVVASAEYRLSGEAKFPAQIFDVKAAIRWLRAHPEVLGGDPERIAIAGFSAGAHLSALAGTTADRPQFEGESGSPGHSTKVSAVIAQAAPTDFTQNPAAYDTSIRGFSAGGVTHEQMLLGGPIDEKSELAHMANPGAFIGPNTPPFLIIHGTQDEVVNISQSDYLFNALQEQSVEVTFFRVQEGNYGCWPAGQPYPTKPIPTQIEECMLSFLQRHLLGMPVFDQKGIIEVSALDME